MNQITNILSGLKKRKASAPPGGDAPAAPSRMAAIKLKLKLKLKPNKVIVPALLVALVASAAGGWWLLSRKQPVPAIKVAQAPGKSAPQSQPIVLPPVEPPVAVEEKMPEETAQAPVAKLAGEKPLEEHATAKPEQVGKSEEVKRDVPGAVASGKAEEEAGANKGKPHKEAPPKEPGVDKVVAKEAEQPVPEEAKDKIVEEAKPAQETPASARIATGSRQSVAANRAKRSKAVAPPVSVAEGDAVEEDAAAVHVPAGDVDKQVKPLTPQQQANNEFIKANVLVQQGNTRDALAGYETVLQLDPSHEAARQAMVVLLLQAKRNADAERVLQEGLKQNIKNSGFAMLLARIQLDRDAQWSALLTLQKTMPYAAEQADYQAFIAALLQRLNHHKEAVAHYQAAVELSPGSGVWWMGMGISLRALQEKEESRTAFKRALETNTLSAELQSFVKRQLREL